VVCTYPAPASSCLERERGVCVFMVCVVYTVCVCVCVCARARVCVHARCEQLLVASICLILCLFCIFCCYRPASARSGSPTSTGGSMAGMAISIAKRVAKVRLLLPLPANPLHPHLCLLSPPRSLHPLCHVCRWQCRCVRVVRGARCLCEQI
jgi:hypothetical protein